MHPLKVKETMSSVDKSIIENLQKKDLTVRTDCVGKLIIRENYVGEFYLKNELLYRKHQETKTGQCFNQLVMPKGLQRQYGSPRDSSLLTNHRGQKV